MIRKATHASTCDRCGSELPWWACCACCTGSSGTRTSGTLPMIDFLSGAVTLSYLLAVVYFLRFWRRTSDRLFMIFAVAFVLFALNQVFLFALDVTDERSNYFFILRVLGFVLILFAILDKNSLFSEKKDE